MNPNLRALRANSFHVAGAAQHSKSKRVREHQGFFGQLDQRQVNCRSIGYTGNQPQMLLSFDQEQRQQIIVDRDGALVALFLGALDAKTVRLGVLDRPLDPQRLGDRVKITPAIRLMKASPPIVRPSVNI